MDLDAAAQAFRDFAAIVQALRAPGTGCPWDLEQTHQTLRRYLIEETYELIDAIDDSADDALQEELGDLLLQIVLHAQLAADRGAFTITDVIRGIAAKMVRRHPHVFGDTAVSGPAEVARNWEEIKAAEKGEPRDEFSRVPASLPALARAQKLGALVDLQGLPLEDMITVLRELSERRGGKPYQAGGLGALLFELTTLARLRGLDAEDCLRDEIDRFIDGHRRAREERK